MNNFEGDFAILNYKFRNDEYDKDIPQIPFRLLSNGTMSIRQAVYTFINTKSVAFNGVTGQSLITIADSPSLSFGADGTIGNEPSFSISAWINMTDATDFSIFCKGDATVREYDFFTSGSDFLRWRIYDSSLNNYIGILTTTMVAFEGAWTHVCATYDASGTTSGMKLYINGSAVATTNFTNGSYTAMHNTATPAGIGRFNAVLLTAIADGFIDEVAAFNKELSAVEISEVYNSGQPSDLNTFSATNNLVSWWRMGDKATGTSPDYTLPDQRGSNDAVMSDFQGTSTSAVVNNTVSGAQSGAVADEGQKAYIVTTGNPDEILYARD